jgi:hypothetical protein
MEEVRKKQRKEEKRKGGAGGAPAVKQRKDLVVSWRCHKSSSWDLSADPPRPFERESLV